MSGAGSLVLKVIGITEPDPIEYGLLFERRLNMRSLNSVKRWNSYYILLLERILYMKFIKWWWKSRDWEDIGYNALFMSILLIIISFMYFCLFTFEKYLFSKVVSIIFLISVILLFIYLMKLKISNYIEEQKEEYNKYK